MNDGQNGMGARMFTPKSIVFLGLALAGLAVMATLFQSPEPPKGRQITYTALRAMSGELKSATIYDNQLIGRDAQGNPVVTTLPADPGVATWLAERGVDVTIAAPADPQSGLGSLVQILVYYGSLLIFFALLLRIARALESGAPRS
ncbi:hypothetical protein ACFSCV_10170 [Methylopila henanensis]|uniref:Peptidase M41 FtsH extracellular domain-containing protein n=1 Tax=Methylopila henanensis TaxID=873516 RepID=A0ABW4K7H9_9HYPH